MAGQLRHKKQLSKRGRCIAILPGQYYDAETGLHYNWHRYYDPDTGRYLTPDPIGLEGGINPFLYTSNNPVNYIDPYGLFLDSTGQYTGASTAAGETAIVLETVGVGSTLGTAVLYTGGGVAAFGFGYFGTSVFIEDTWLDGGIGDYLYDLLHDSPTNDPCGGRKEYQPKKPGRKKQGREPGEKKRQKPGWKPRNPAKEPPRHTPSRKN